MSYTPELPSAPDEFTSSSYPRPQATGPPPPQQGKPPRNAPGTSGSGLGEDPNAEPGAAQSGPRPQAGGGPQGPYVSPPPPPGPPPQYQQPLHYSPDGHWYWSGQQWVPASSPAAGRSKGTAGVLGILLGDFGAHKFYLGEPGLGILYLVFCWTLIPGLIGFIEGLIYLTMSDQDFANRYNRAALAHFPAPPPQVSPHTGG